MHCCGSVIGWFIAMIFHRIFIDAQVTVHITPKSISHFFKHEMHMLHDDLIRLRPSAFRSTYLSLELTIDHLQVIHLKLPRVFYETTSNPDKINLKLTGGSAEVLGRYEAVYKTKREGQFTLSINHFDFSLMIRKTSSLKIEASESCSLSFDEFNILMNPPLPEQITKMIESNIMMQLQHFSCKHAIGFIENLSGMIPSFVKTTDISEDGTRPSTINSKVSIESDNLRSHHPNAIQISVPVAAINLELAKLARTATTRFLWSSVPEVQEKLASCHSVECGQFEASSIVSVMRKEPHFRIDAHNQMHLIIPLTTFLDDDGFEILNNFHLILTDIKLSSPINSLILWSATYRIRKIDTLQTISSKKYQHLVSKIEDQLNNNYEFIENLFNNYLQGALPLNISNSITWPHHIHAFPFYQNGLLNFYPLPHLSTKIRILSLF